MSKVFYRESGVITAFSKIADTVILCVLWLIFCIPVVTVGASSSALYYAYHKAIRQDRGHLCRTFFGAFKSNFLQATGIWVALFLFAAASLITCCLLGAMRGSVPMMGVFLAFGMMILGFVTAWMLVLFPYQSRFKNSLPDVLKNSAVIAFANILWAMVLVVLFALAVGVTLYDLALGIPAAAIYLWLSNMILERIFRKVMTAEEYISEKEADGL